MDGHTHAEWFDSDGNYHAVLDGHAVTIPRDAITGDDDADADQDTRGGTHMDANSHARYAYIQFNADGDAIAVHGIAYADGNQYTARTVIHADAIAASRGAAPERAIDERADGRAGTGRQQPEHPLGR